MKKDFPQDTKTLVDYTVIYPEIGELLRECEYDFHAGRKMRKLGLVIHNLIEKELKAENDKIVEQIDEITLNTAQSTEIFSEIESDYKKTMEHLIYSAPEVIRLKLNNFLWGVYIKGRVGEKIDILKAIKLIKKL